MAESRRGFCTRIVFNSRSWVVFSQSQSGVDPLPHLGGNVRQRQVRHDPQRAGQKLRVMSHVGAGGPDDVVVGDHHGLGVARGSRGVDQGAAVAGLLVGDPRFHGGVRNIRAECRWGGSVNHSYSAKFKWSCSAEWGKTQRCDWLSKSHGLIDQSQGYKVLFCT